jgi:hydrogenase maturation protease
VLTAPTPVRLLVCGNPHRGDDGASLTAVAGLLADLPPHLLAALDVRHCEQLDIDELVDLPGSTACVVVDTVVGVTPGEIVELSLAELPDRDAEAAPVARSTHVLPLGQVVAIAGILRDRAVDGRFVGIGGGSFEFGHPIDRRVRAALPAYRAAIAAALVAAATERIAEPVR